MSKAPYSLPQGFTENKASGNEEFKKGNFSAAIASYSAAIVLVEEEEGEGAGKRCAELGIVYSNRALCFLKLDQYEKCVQDATSSVRISPSSVKALYRRAQALHQLGRSAAALDDVRKVLQLEPTNPEALSLGGRLSREMELLAKQTGTIQGQLQKIFSVLSDESAGAEERSSFSKDLAVLSRENAAAQELIRRERLQDIVQLLPSLPSSSQKHLLQALVGLCQGSAAGVQAVLAATGFSLIESFLHGEDSALMQAAASILFHSLSSLLAARDAPVPQPQLHAAEELTRRVLEWIGGRGERLIGPAGRDVLLESLMPTVSCAEMRYCLMKSEFVNKLLLSCTPARCSGKTRSCVTSLLHNFYQSLGSDKSRRKSVQDTCFCFIMYRIRDEEDLPSCLEGLSVLSVLSQASPELGNEMLGNEKIFSVALRLAASGDEGAQLVAVESIALAASDKDRYHALLETIPVLKSLYLSGNPAIRVRALVGICKLSTLSKDSAALDASADTLEAACREFLTQPHSDGIKRWAVEGLAFLSISAPVKQSLCADEQLLLSVINLAATCPDTAVQYGAASLFVNLTNSYEKPDRNPELEELARFSGEHVPTPHPLDGEEYVAERVSLLLRLGVIPALNQLARSSSLSTCEQTSRVFLALVDEQKNRGKVVQQGAGRSLILLAKNNSEAGLNLAAQAIAKISITTNPELAFPGERVLETIAPLVRLLKSERQLQQFEALLALTNLSSLGAKFCKKIFVEKGVHWIETLQFEEHEMLRRAATECMCNLVVCEEVKELYRQEGNDRVKLLTLFSGEDDTLLQKAASGALCILSEEVKVCRRILDVSQYFEITEQLLVSEEEELQFRAVYTLSNLVLASRGTAERVLEYERGLELFELCISDQFSERVRGVARAALEQLVSYGLVQNNHHMMKSKNVRSF